MQCAVSVVFSAPVKVACKACYLTLHCEGVVKYNRATQLVNNTLYLIFQPFLSTETKNSKRNSIFTNLHEHSDSDGNSNNIITRTV